MILVKNAFIAAINMCCRKNITYKRLGDTDIEGTVRLANSNYFRHLTVDGDVTQEGYEFIILKVDIDAIAGLGSVKKGDIIEHPDHGIITVGPVKALHDTNGETIAYRVWTQ